MTARYPLGPFTPYAGNPVLRPTPGRLDADLVAIDAPPVETHDSRLVFLTNGARIVDREAGLVQYSCGQLAVSVDDPGAVLHSTDEPGLAPSTTEDRVGLVGNVTFVQGLVQHRGEWLAYCGQADTTLAVASAVG